MMACKYICDGCGEEKDAVYNGRAWIKPHTWYERGDDHGLQTACSRECIEIVAKKSGKTDLVLPF